MLDTTDWTHEETARRLGLNRVTVSNYARGRLAPSRTVLLFMAHLTRNVVDLPGFHDTSGVVQEPGAGELSQWEQETLGLMRRLNPTQRQAILGVLATMATPVTYGGESVQSGRKDRRASAEETKRPPTPPKSPTSPTPKK